MSTAVRTTSRHFFKRMVLRLVFFMLLPGLMGCTVLNAIQPETATPTPSRTPTVTPTRTLTPTPSLTPTATEQPALCNGPRAMYILLVGSDSRSSGYTVGLADSINVARVDFVMPRVQMLSFQRDLYVDIPGIESHSITVGKLNQAFLYGNPGYGFYDGEGQGPGLLASTLTYNFDVQVDHYVAVNLQSFVKIVDALGGINISLPYEVDGRVKGSRDSDRYFPSGSQYLNGYRTMLLARMRPLGAFKRNEVQSLIMEALARKLFSPTVIPQLPELIDTFYSAVQTDLGVTEINQLVCLAGQLRAQQIEFVNFPESLFENGRVRDPVLGSTAILNADFEILKKYVQAFNQGTWLEAEGTLETSSPIP
jgi:LCP family protein required for cell wall assembly